VGGARAIASRRGQLASVLCAKPEQSHDKKAEDMKTEPMLLVSEPILGLPEKAALADVIDSGWITMGDRVNSFERAFADAHGAEDAVSVSSCTAGLHLILHALGIGPGDEVLVPAITFVATANCVLYVGAKPVFVDIESTVLPLMSIQDAMAKSTSRTKAVILVHFAGYMIDPEPWQAFARERGLMLIEDAAHASGLPGAGAIGDAAAFSFYGNKNMTTAEGGVVLAREAPLRDAIRRARGHGLTTGTFQRRSSRTPIYDVTMLGFNYRLDELRAAIGLVQLGRLGEWNAKRKSLAGHYRSQIREKCPSVVIPFEESRPSVHHIMPVVLPDSCDRQDVIDHLRAKGIQTTVHYPATHRLSFYRNLYPDVKLWRTEAFSDHELTLPLHPRMEQADVERVSSALAEALGEHAAPSEFANRADERTNLVSG
jgi:dTDP-4-amino-4,6-dideoxygalactose transaminase